jgi:hypothetical protein
MYLITQALETMSVIIPYAEKNCQCVIDNFVPLMVWLFFFIIDIVSTASAGFR